MQTEIEPENRYRKPCKRVYSQLDPLSDLLSWLEFFTAGEYVVDVLTTRHGLDADDAKARTEAISRHVRLAKGFLEQSLNGPDLLAFLPAYYAILNLMKVYVLTGSRHGDLPGHRHHGMTFDTTQTCGSVLEETVTLKTTGALPLFYEAITGERLTGQTLRMGEVYRYVVDIESEYQMATGQMNALAPVHLDPYGEDGSVRVKATFETNHVPEDPSELRLLHDPKKEAHSIYLSGAIPIGDRPRDDALEDVMANKVRWYLLYSTRANDVRTPLWSGELLLPEELPIAILFFHIGSVVRYHPEFFERLQSTKYWPLLTVARKHSLLRFLLLFWAYMHQEITLFSSSE